MSPKSRTLRVATAIAAGSGDRRDLAVRRRYGAAGRTAGGGDRRILAHGVAVERQDAALEILPQDRFDGQGKRIPAPARGQDRDPVAQLRLADRREMQLRRRALRDPAFHRRFGDGRSSSDTTLVSGSTDMPQAQSKVGGSRAGSRGGNSRSTPAERRDPGANGLGKVPGTRLAPNRVAQDQPRLLLHRAVVFRRANPQPRLHILVAVADRDARQIRFLRSSRAFILETIALQLR